MCGRRQDVFGVWAPARHTSCWKNNPGPTIFSHPIRCCTHRTKRRSLALALRVLQTFLDRVSDFELNIQRLRARRVHLYTDASLVKRDGAVTSAMVGGVLVRDSYDMRGFSLKVTDIPKWMSSVNIEVLELIAAHLARLLFKADLGTDFVVHHIDNRGAVYEVLKCSAGNDLSQSVVTVMAEDRKCRDGYDYFRWISTERNPSDDMTRLEKYEGLLSFFPQIRVVSVSEEMIPWGAYKSVYVANRSISVDGGSSSRKRAKIDRSGE